MIIKSNFSRWFNRDYWRAFNKLTFPIKIPTTEQDKRRLVEKVYEDIKSARYTPNIPEAELVMNKGYGVARTVPVFCIEDYCVYYFCIKELEDVLCGNRTPNTFGGWTLGGKLRQLETEEIECEFTEYGRYSFNPQAWTKAFGEFNSLLFAQLDQENFTHVLQFDLSNFYDCVRLDILERWIREEANSEKGWIVTLLFYLLNQWNRRNTGLHPQAVGLPQDALADCSRILANYYMQRYDKFAASVCAKAGALYFRYADDQMILMNDPEKVEVLLLLLTRELDRYGLRVNQKKVDFWTASQLQQHRCRTIQEIFSKEGDNKNPKLVRRFVSAYLSIPKVKLEKSWNRGIPLLNRLLGANLESLPRKLYKEIVERLTCDKYLLLADHRKLERIFTLNKKLSPRINLVRQLSLIGKKTVHNSFHHEVYAFAVAKKLHSLKKLFKARLMAIRKQMRTHEIV